MGKDNNANYLRYKSKLKLKAGEKHASMDEHMVTLNAVEYATGECMKSAASKSDKDDEEDEDTI